MKLTRVEVEHFGCLRRARVDLGPGLNVIYGPNDLGKSTLTHAVRAALLLTHSSSEAKSFAPWYSDEDPVAKVTFSLPDGRFWQVEKRFGSSGASLLRESNDGLNFNAPFKKGREVDAELREKLAWGVASPATKGIKRGLPITFLSTVLLGEQANVTQVLKTTLEADTDESGRERLTAALSAFAQDPLFKRMLGTGQSKIDEAFTATGKRKRGAASPFVAATEQVKQAKAALELLQQRAAESEGAIQELAQKNQAQLAFHEALEERTQRLDGVRAALKQQAERHAVQSTLVEATEARRVAQAKLDEFKKREADLDAVQAKRQTLMDAKSAVEQQQKEAQQRLRAAEESLSRAQSQEAEQARQIRRGQLEKQLLELESSAKSLADEREKMERAHKLHDEKQVLEADLAALAERETLATETSEKSKLAKTDAETALRDLDLARRLRRVRELEAELAQLQTAKGEADERVAEAKAMREAEAQARARLRHDLPAPSEIAVMRQLLNDRKVAEAGLGGGMAISIERLQAVDIKGTCDGVPLDLAADGTVRFDADRAFTLSIGDMARVNVSAGSPEVRQRCTDLQAQVETDVDPVLKRLGVEDLPALSALVEANEGLLRECEKLANEARSLESIAAAKQGNLSKLDSLPAQLSDARNELRDTPTASAEALLEQVGDSSLEGREAELRTQATAAGERFEEAIALTRECGTKRQLLQQKADSTKQALSELGVAVPDAGWAAAELELQRRGEQLVAQRVQTETEMSGLLSEQASEVTNLEAGVANAKLSLEEANHGLAETTRNIGEIEKQAATLEAEINMSRASIESVDVLALEGRVTEIRTQLDALPAPAHTVSTEDEQQALASVESAKREFEQARDDVRKAEGRLQTVSGQVVVEETDRAKEALVLAEQTEREIEVDYDGWKLLVEALRNAENTEGQHLGEALSQPVSERFAALTGERYSKLEVLPTLGAEGVRVSGIVREVDALSVGTQEQLATLLRLTIAEQLGAMLILDDHLTQTDSDRIDWFRKLLRTHASSAQLIVMTCHALDYLEPAEMPASGESLARSTSGLVHAIDLSRLIERSDPVGAASADG